MTDNEFLDEIISIRFTPVFRQNPWRHPSDPNDRYSVFVFDLALSEDVSQETAKRLVAELKGKYGKIVQPLLDRIRFEAGQLSGLPFESVTYDDVQPFMAGITGEMSQDFVQIVLDLFRKLLEERKYLHSLLRDLSLDGALQHYQAGVAFARKEIRDNLSNTDTLLSQQTLRWLLDLLDLKPENT